MHRGLACWLAGVLVVAAVAAPVAGAGTPDGPFGVGQEDFDPDNVTLSAAINDDGSAAWSFKYRMELTTENETAAFESLQEDIEQNRSDYIDRFRARIEGTVGTAENATGREMSVENVSVRAFQQPGGEFVDSYGFVEYTFEWNGFAAVEDERITAGDALEGFYLNNQTALQFSWEDGYEAADTDPPADESSDKSVRWSGPEDFGTDQPRVVLEPSETTGGTTDGTTTSGGGAGEGSQSVLVPILVGGAIAVVVLGGGAWVYWRREHGDGGGFPSPTADSDGTDGGGGGAGAASGGTGDAAAGAEDGSADAASGATAGAAAGETGDDTPEELLSNEERVQRYLREQGGRAKQQDVVDAMGWTEAKTSQVVKQMREDDDLESFRIGRENVLKLPDADQYEE